MKILIVILCVLMVIFLLSCKKQIDNIVGHKWITYRIKKDKHSSTKQIAPFHGTTLKFNVIFDDSAIYTTSDPNNQGDINKLFGFSDCNSLHHENSARMGWRWYNNKLEIHAYTYVNGTRNSSKICDVNLHEEVHYEIQDSGNKYVFIVNNSIVVMDRGCSNKGGIKYYLFSYYGGDETAPHDITIKIKEMN